LNNNFSGRECDRIDAKQQEQLALKRFKTLWRKATV
jgi:hypothetical protein